MVFIINVLLVFLVIYLLGKWIIRGVVSRFLFGSIKKNLRHQQENMAWQKNMKEGHITIHYHQPKSNKIFGKDEGVYVDFENLI